MTHRKTLWTEMTSPEIGLAAKEGAIVVFPTGSIEQHGPHLPLDTDISSTFEVAKRAAERVEDARVIVAPPFNYGISRQHKRFPGTLYIEETTYMTLLQEVCMSIANSGFRKILVLNGHGGNASANDVALRGTIAWEPGVIVVAANYWYLANREKLAEIRESEWGGTGHACEFETSIQLVLKPHVVNVEEARKAVGEWRPPKPKTKWKPVADLIAQPQQLGLLPLFPVFKDPVGILGNPLLASREKGEKFIEACVEGLVDFLEHFKKISDYSEF